MELDKLFLKLGQPGLYHVLVYCLLFLNWIPVSNNILVMAFFGAEPPHRCFVPDGLSINRSLPVSSGDDGVTHSKCYAYKGFSSTTNETVACPMGWHYEDDALTIVTEWNLVCDNAYLVNIATAMFFVGVMFGGLTLGPLSDKYGRRPILLFSLYFPIGIATAMVFVHNYFVFIVLRFLLGVCMLGLEMTSVVLISEIYPASLRTFPGSVVNLAYGVGNLYLALISYLLKDWHYIQLAIHLPSVLMICQVWLIPESPRWLLTKEMYEDVRQFFHKAAKFNKVQFSDESFDEHVALLMERKRIEKSHDEEVKERTFSFTDLLKTPKLRLRSLLLFFQWFALCGCYLAMTLSITAFDGDRYVNFLIGAITEVPTYVVASIIAMRCSRLRPLACYYAIGGVCCILAGCIPSKTAEGVAIAWLPTGFALLGRVTIAAGFCVQYLYSAEMFPTVVRNVGLGTCAFFSRLGAVFVPQILFLRNIGLKELSMVSIGVLALGASGATFILPETKGRPLTDTIQDAEKLTRKEVVKDKMLSENEISF